MLNVTRVTGQRRGTTGPGVDHSAFHSPLHVSDSGPQEVPREREYREVRSIVDPEANLVRRSCGRTPDPEESRDIGVPSSPTV